MPLQRAIKRGLKPGGDLAGEIREVGEYSIRSRGDARAIVHALHQLPLNGEKDRSFSSDLHALTGLFQDIESVEVPACRVLADEGIPQLIRIFDDNLHGDDSDLSDDLLFILKIFALYGTEEGANRIVEAARLRFNPGAYMWHLVLSILSGGHPHRDFVFDALSDPMPTGFLAVALLDAANSSAIEGNLENHPFDSVPGREQIQRWLSDRDPEHFSYAHSATAALPFISNPDRDKLMALAMDHAETGVQLEAAWAAGKLGREAGLKMLSRYCVDMTHSEVAKWYLAELEREDLIPEAAHAPDFHAKSRFSNWLAHPNELGRSPDEVEIVDDRDLKWPLADNVSHFWLLRYRSKDTTGLDDDDVGVGFVGTMTWCFFFYKMHLRPPEDIYAIHCCWEMEHAELVVDSEVTDHSEYANFLAKWNGEPLEQAAIVRVAELSPKLGFANRIVSVATASIGGESGWAVIDDGHSSWYPAREQPDGTSDTIILKIHVGRRLLGFSGATDRTKFLNAAPARRKPEQIVTTYEKLIDELSGADSPRLNELIRNHSLLPKYFDAYVNAAGGDDQSDRLVRVYERVLEAAEGADASVQTKLCDSFSLLCDKFTEYVDAMVERKRTDEISRLVTFFDSHWDHNLGYGKLGTAAFRAGRTDVAEKYFLKLHSGLESYYRSEEMSMMAEIWHSRGEIDQARGLLLDCLRKTLVEIQTSKYNSDREMFAQEYLYHRATYLKLYPGSEEWLLENGILVDPLESARS